jgi:hypothetical protein
MKRKNFIDIVSNLMLSLKKAHVYNSVLAINLTLVLLVVYMVIGCQKTVIYRKKLCNRPLSMKNG